MATAHPKKKSSRARSSAAIEKQLSRYRSMRNFDVTAEPRGGNKESKKRAAEKDSELPFVIQKHAATRLHYDFRLGWHGVLKSWAVTKGPSYYPGDKRLAVQVEDHPMEYGGFEGIIPKGQYGGGTVMLWDHGTWEPHGDVDEGLEKGRLKFTLKGEKLHGDWALIRMGGKAAGEKKANWLLIKEHDGQERGPDDPPVTEEEPDSVVTGRDLDAIAENQDHVWGTQGSQQQKERQKSRQHTAKEKPARTSQNSNHRHDKRNDVPPKVLSFASELKSAPKESLPKFVPPQLATQVTEAPDGSEWIHELKLDGYRMQGRIASVHGQRSRSVALITRGGLDWTHRMPDIAAALVELPVEEALLDGEVVVFDEEGKTSFADLQAAFQEGRKKPLTYVIFDLLHLNGHNLRNLPLEQRKNILEKILAQVSDGDHQGILRYSHHLNTRGGEIFEKACQLGAEGIVSKEASAPYTSGRSGTWLKIKCVRQQEFVIGGFTPPTKTGVGIGALLLGYYRDRELIYAGRTGTGFTQKARLQMRKRLEEIRQERPAFSNVPPDGARDAQWVQPKYVCEVKFATWTADNLVRQASFQGLREDKPAKQVTRELPVATDTAKESSPTKSARTASSRPARKKSSAASVSSRNHRSTRTAARVIASKTNPGKSSKAVDTFPIVLTHPDKQVDSETKLTKQQLADYFWAVREHMLPHIVDRPLSIVRCPQGSTKPCFFQKHVTDSLPDGIDGIDIRGRRSGVVESYITLSSALGLAGLAQMGVLEIHPWGSTNNDIEKPDRLVFDLDPDEAIPWKTLAESAKEVRSRLKQCKLESFLKTTGGKGLHVVAPIAPEHDWPVIKEFAHGIANQMADENKALYLTKMTKADRKGKIFIDYLRNDRGATSIAPFSPRARPGAPVAVPMDWMELDSAKPPRFLVADFSDWKSRLRHDPWTAMLKKRQAIPAKLLEPFTSSQASGSRRSARKD
ncbi:MAG TPA: DNA ligase D [Acidobacteriaceae bacterium]|nr:DNA ligase D [Acidobacteriaceae bacterium]